jgi:hypothetical protein
MAREPVTDLDIVALLRDLLEFGLERGQTGTVVLSHGQGEAYEVEFLNRRTGLRGGNGVAGRSSEGQGMQKRSRCRTGLTRQEERPAECFQS